MNAISISRSLLLPNESLKDHQDSNVAQRTRVSKRTLDFRLYNEHKAREQDVAAAALPRRKCVEGEREVRARGDATCQAMSSDDAQADAPNAWMDTRPVTQLPRR